MALCCIGGVCVPYSAILPLLALCLKWVVTKLVQMGVIPSQWVPKSLVGATTSQSTCCDTASCCTTETKGQQDTEASSHGAAVDMPHITSPEEWQELCKNTNNAATTLIVAKMTATWCRPCQQVQPHFARLAAQYQQPSAGCSFCTVDVDGCDDLASQFNVAMMPTFLVLRQEKDNNDDQKASWKHEEMGRYSGSDVAQLSCFLAKHLS